jgi:hypothetical protein
MSTRYFGLICKHCNGGYPSGINPAPPRYLLKVGPYDLYCLKCQITERYDDFVLWDEEQEFSGLEVARLNSCITRVPVSDQFSGDTD